MAKCLIESDSKSDGLAANIMVPYDILIGCQLSSLNWPGLLKEFVPIYTTEGILLSSNVALLLHFRICISYIFVAVHCT